MTDASVESLIQIQLTFQDKSTDKSLEEKVTREGWLDGVATKIEASKVTDAILIAEFDEVAEDSAAIVTVTVAAVTPMEVDEIDFSTEPVPEALTESSEKIASHLGSLTLPAALCDEELLGELAGIPNKMGFKIGEVADLLGIKQYVLRYWETEFDVLKPKKAANNQRYYTKKDVENVYLIRKLLHRDRFSIEGARSAMRDLKQVVKKEKDWNSVNTKVDTLQERLDHLLVDLRKLKQLFAD